MMPRWCSLPSMLTLNRKPTLTTWVETLTSRMPQTKKGPYINLAIGRQTSIPTGLTKPMAASPSGPSTVLPNNQFWQPQYNNNQPQLVCQLCDKPGHSAKTYRSQPLPFATPKENFLNCTHTTLPWIPKISRCMLSLIVQRNYFLGQMKCYHIYLFQKGNYSWEDTK